MTQARSTVPATKEKIAAIESQEDRCPDKGFDKICTMNHLKAIWEDACLSKKKKKKEEGGRKGKKKKRERQVTSTEGSQSAGRPMTGCKGQKKLSKGMAWVTKFKVTAGYPERNVTKTAGNVLLASRKCINTMINQHKYGD